MADTIHTKAPQSHIDSFLTGCKGRGVPTATCTCMMKELSATREGDAALDAMDATRDSEARRAGVVLLLNRHGLRLSELRTAVDPQGPLMKQILKQCE